MDQATHNKIVSFIWGIADDVLRDLFKRGKYPDAYLDGFSPNVQDILDNFKFRNQIPTVSRTEREIDLLREYRTRLIADVVTGKLDVRETAARLPEEAEEIEESLMLDDEQDNSDDNELEAV